MHMADALVSPAVDGVAAVVSVSLLVVAAALHQNPTHVTWRASFTASSGVTDECFIEFELSIMSQI